ncbi:TetR family transcriptional regulator [Leptobacterium flavescens]|uniref:TetR family transcriptional regulator n=1 Tax=Leptobacterium flavescens TaxID=472055 RepID=A0A6P0UP10_9FLAO|nr:TetR family transcriptional regulator [Leptobacterium flavescens]NER14905.1 TetR family transcriptional regulator [Leptobacterium flavescens]
MKTENRKEEIINISSKLFKEKGYSAVSMRDIAQAMGIKAASLYNHITSKQEILSIIILDVAEKFTRGMDRIVESEDNAIDKLEKIIELHVNVTVNNADALGSLNNDWMHLVEPQLSYFLKLRSQYEENFRQIVKLGVDEGHLEPLNVEVMLFSILSTLRTLYLWYYKKEGVDTAELVVQMKTVLLRGVVLKP